MKRPQTSEAKKRGLGADLALKIGFTLAADTRTPKARPAAEPDLREALPKGRNFH